jgi:hypothetical protein
MIEKIVDADITGQIFYEGSRANLYELARIKQILEELTEKGTGVQDIVVLCPFSFMVTVTRRLLVASGFHVRVESVHKFDGQEAPVVIAAMVGGVAFLDSVPLVSSVTSRCQRRMFLLVSSFYELLPKDHALLLYSACFPECEVEVSIEEKQVPWDLGLFDDSNLLRKHRATAPEVPAEPEDSWSPSFYDPGDHFWLGIKIYHTVREELNGQSISDGCIVFRFESRDGQEVFQDQLCQATGFANAINGYASSQVLQLQQLAKLSTNLIPSSAYVNSGRYAPKRCHIDMEFFSTTTMVKALPPQYVIHELKALNSCSCASLTMTIRRGTYTRTGRGTPECIEFMGEELATIADKLQIPRDTVAIYANHNSMCVYVNELDKPKIAGVFEFVNQGFSRGELKCLGQSVFLRQLTGHGMQGNRSYSWTHESVKSLYVVGGFWAAWWKASQIAIVDMVNENCYNVIGTCVATADEFEAQDSDRVHALEWRCLGALAVLQNFAFPHFRLVTSTTQRLKYQFIRWYLARTPFNFRGFRENCRESPRGAEDYRIRPVRIASGKYAELNSAARRRYEIVERCNPFLNEGQTGAEDREESIWLIQS